MKLKNIFFMAAAMAGLVAFSACSDDDTPSGEPYLTFDKIDGPIKVSKEGITQRNRKSVTIRSNRAWQVGLENPQDTSWIKVFVDEGEDDGIIQYWIKKNETFTAREGKINLLIDGAVANSLDIQQEPSIPTAQVDGGVDSLSVVPNGDQLALAVDHNIEWTATIDPAVTWARITKTTEDSIFITVDKNDEDERYANLVITGTGEYSSAKSTTVIDQKDNSLIYSETFDWLHEGEEKPYYEYPEIRFDRWTDEDRAAGWSSFNETNLFGGIGYIKLGKTNKCGDAVSPMLSRLKKETNVTVTFQAIGYISVNGSKDKNVIKVAVLGPGTIEGENMSTISIDDFDYPCVRFTTDVYPNSSKNEHGDDYDPWAQPGSNFSFKIKGATGETQLVFVGGDGWGNQPKTKNRVMIDNINVVKIK